MSTQAITGFLLTRQWREQDDGLTFLFWIHTEQGPLQVTVAGQEAVCFFPTEQRTGLETLLAGVNGWRTRPLELKSFFYQPVAALYLRSQRQLQRCRDLCADAGIPLWEADIRSVDRYLSERFITGEVSVAVPVDMAGDQHLPPPASSSVAKNKRVAVKELAKSSPAETAAPVHRLLNPRLQQGPRFEPSLRMISLDIETALDGSQLFSIAVYAADFQQVWILGSDVELANADVPVIACADEKNLLEQFLSWLQHYDPDILIGWNVVNFDLKFLQQRCDKLRLPFRIGRAQEEAEWRQARDESQHHFILIPGRVVLDGVDTLKAATWNFESFSLEYVSRQLLQRGKLIHDVDDRGAEIMQLFQQDKPALARYNLEDCRLVWDIFEKAGLLHFALERSRLTGLPLDKVGGSVAAFENLYLPRLHRAGFVAPNIGDVQSDIAAPGGYVMESRPGLFEHVLVLDFKSLYPSIIRTFCIDPLSLVKGRFEGDPDVQNLPPDIFRRKSKAPNSAASEWIPGYHGAQFSKQHHLLPEIIRQLWQARDEAKKARNQPLSQAIKIIMNSFYGVLGTPLCRFFDPRLSSAITLRGHDIMQQTRVLIEQQGYTVIYGDTDSVFIWLQGVRDDAAADGAGRELAQFLNQWWRDKLQQVFGLESCLELQYETHYRRFFMPTMRGSDTGSKKRYAGLVNSGDKEKLVFKGLENVRTDWTPLARRVQYDVCWKIFHDEDVQAYLQNVVQDLHAGRLDDELVYRKRIRRRLAEYRKNVPPHAQAAKKADQWLQQQNRATRYARGGWVSYVMTVNGPEPLECRESRLDYEHYLQRQLAPAVDGMLYFRDQSLQGIVQSQMSLF
ncbi:MAG TPA: DNA polymerase II [Dongiaceae bacterium]|nr:DNA polymerase II [Dongiaceae bacterium]